MNSRLSIYQAVKAESSKEDLWHVGFSLILAAFAFLSLCRSWPMCVSGAAVILTDIYLAFVLAVVGLQAHVSDESLPHKLWSIPLLFFLVIALICSFGNMYLKSNGVRSIADKPIALETPLDGAYFSAVTLTTLGYGDFVPANRRARALVVWQLGSGALLLLVVFPIVASRLATWEKAPHGNGAG